MCFQPLASLERPRELRRRVVLPARMSFGGRWSDTCILNISSRGLLVRSPQNVPSGTAIQLLRGNQLITARVMWSDGNRSGLQTDERIAVEDILSLDQSATSQLAASHPGKYNPPAPAPKLRPDTQSRWLEFLGVGAIVIGLALAAGLFVEQALGPPLAKVTAALGGQS